MESGSSATGTESARRLSAIRFAVLGSALITTIAAVMILTPLATNAVALQVLISVPLLASLYALGGDFRLMLLLAGAITALAALATLSAIQGDTWLLIVDIGLRAVILAVVIAVVGSEVIREVRISLDTILGGICVYLLIGFFYAHVYLMLVLADIGALLTQDHPLAALSSPHPLRSAPAVVYYSYATLTTVAYGDITPATPLARFVAITEAMIGQLFPAIFIARLVSLNVAQSYSSDDDGGSI